MNRTKLRRKGQVFLIITILVVSFIIGISSILLDIKRSDFIEPSPGASETLDAWQTSVESLEQMMDVYAAQTSQGNYPDITQAIDNLEMYLTDRGITNSIQNSTITNSTVNTPAELSNHTVSGTFYIFLSSSSTTIEQNLTITISYVVVATTTDVVVSRTINGEQEFLSSASLDVSVSNLGNGVYTHSEPAGTVITVTTVSQVILSVTVP